MEPNLTVTAPVSRHFPGLSGHLFVVVDLDVATQSSDLKSSKEETCRSCARSTRSKTFPTSRLSRPIGLDIDPTTTRPAREALVRRTLQGKSQSTINTFVEAYNLASLTTKVPLAAFNRDSLGPALKIRFAEEGELFLGIDMDESTRLNGGELVIEDDGTLVAVYPYRDPDGTEITVDTIAALILVCGAPDGPTRSSRQPARQPRST